MTLKRKILMGLTATALLAPAVSPVVYMTSAAAVVSQQTQGAGMVALGGSLSGQDATQTLQLLGAGNVDQSKIIYVDGPMVNQYLQDGSNAGTTVLSSAFIQPMQEGYGVQVQIVTPQNITQVSQLTYQNAAITAGARNAQIRIATVSPVTGEGALAGVYALLESTGTQVNPQDAQVAQQEISVVNNVSQYTQLNNIQVNQIIAQVKAEVTTNIVNNVQVDEATITNIVNQVLEANGVNPDENPEVTQEVVGYAEEYANTDAAQNEETIQQLETSIQGSWSDILPTLQPTQTAEDILAGERLDFSEQSEFHPILQAFADRFYQVVESGELVENTYAQTFTFEAMTPGLSTEEKNALNELRAQMYQYASSQVGDVKDTWLNQLNGAQQMRSSDPVLAEIVQQVANATGLAPEVFAYRDFEQDGTVIQMAAYYDGPDHQSVAGRFAYDTATQEIFAVDEMMNVTPLTPFDFQTAYGVSVENAYIPSVEIPADYRIPGYTPEESTESSEEGAEETGEETPADAPTEEAPVEEPIEEPAPAEEVIEEPVTVPQDPASMGEEGTQEVAQ